MAKPTNLNFIMKVIEYMEYMKDFKQEHITFLFVLQKKPSNGNKGWIEIRKSKARGNSLSLSIITCIHKIDYNFDDIDCMMYIYGFYYQATLSTIYNCKDTKLRWPM